MTDDSAEDDIREFIASLMTPRHGNPVNPRLTPISRRKKPRAAGIGCA